MNDQPIATVNVNLGQQFSSRVLEPMKRMFVGKDEVIDLLGVSLVAGENIFILGPPGTAKSAIVHRLAQQIDGRCFDYLLTRFTEPNEIFGPFDIRQLREGNLVTNTEGMLPEADFVFLDELLHANSAVLNSLLMVLNERVFRRGRESQKLPTLIVVGASNHLPEDDALNALFDRFLIRAVCDNVETDQLSNVLIAGWNLEDQHDVDVAEKFSVSNIRAMQASIRNVSFGDTRKQYGELILRLRQAGIEVSDRRAVKLQRLLAASAILCDRTQVNLTDFWILNNIWDNQQQQEVLRSIVGQYVDQALPEDLVASHPAARSKDAPEPEQIAASLESINDKINDTNLTEVDRSLIDDQLGLLRQRCQWVSDDQKRVFLNEKIDSLWKKLGKDSP